MGKIRIKKIGFEEAEKPEKKKKEKAKKKTGKVPGLKGGERIKMVEGVVIKEEAPKETPPVQEEKKAKKKVRKPKTRSKKYQKAAKLVDKTKLYPIDEALELVKKTSLSNFEAAVEAHINLFPKFLGNKFVLTFPHKTGRKPIILAFGKDGKKAGADIEGDEKTIKKIAEGFKDFSVVLATPEWMSKLARVAKFLGPRGLMPNPQAGTVTENLKEAIKKFKSGKTTLSTEKKAPIIHTVLGKINWPKKDLKENLTALINTIGEAKIKKLTLCASMGPGIKVNLTTSNTVDKSAKLG